MLDAYLADQDEAWLHGVYDLGRCALDANCGLLEVTELHQT
jgi:Phosphoserine phosphatase RsbU, N-terminal domain